MRTTTALLLATVYLVLLVSACGENEEANKPRIEKQQTSAIDETPIATETPKTVDQIRDEIQELNLQRIQAEEEKVRLELEAQQLQDEINNADNKTAEILTKIDQLEAAQYKKDF